MTHDDHQRIEVRIKESEESVLVYKVDDAKSKTIDFLAKYKLVDDRDARYFRRVFETFDTDHKSMLNNEQVGADNVGYFAILSDFHCLVRLERRFGRFCREDARQGITLTML